jgi:hypothetical protein
MTLQILAIVAAVFHVLGIASAVQAIMETRTPQGAVAWVLGLITFPLRGGARLLGVWPQQVSRLCGPAPCRSGQDRSGGTPLPGRT